MRKYLRISNNCRIFATEKETKNKLTPKTLTGTKIMKTTANTISTKMRNLMSQYVGKSFNYFYGGHQYMWTVKVIGVMDCGYFITEVNDGESTWQSNASYGEFKCNIKKGFFIEA